MPETTLRIPIIRVHPGFDDLPLPTHATAEAAGVDLRAAIEDSLVLNPGDILAIPTNLSIALPVTHEAQVRPRSGLALNHGIILPNSPGTIDADFRGEIKIIMANIGKAPFIIRRGDRIAQLVVARVVRIAWDECETLPDTGRGGGGFGHSGLA